MVTPLETPCIEYPGCKRPDGRGWLSRGGKTYLAHRWAWEQVHGPIPAGIEIMHRCDNPPCWNVAHLQAGTHAENMADMKAKGRGGSRNRGVTHCPQGHEYTTGNTYIEPRTGFRQCVACGPATQARYRARRRAIRRGEPVPEWARLQI